MTLVPSGLAADTERLAERAIHDAQKSAWTARQLVWHAVEDNPGERDDDHQPGVRTWRGRAPARRAAPQCVTQGD